MYVCVGVSGGERRGACEVEGVRGVSSESVRESEREEREGGGTEYSRESCSSGWSGCCSGGGGGEWEFPPKRETRPATQLGGKGK